MDSHPDPVAPTLALELEASYSANDIARLSGLTYRQVDYYARIDVLHPTAVRACGSGTRRRYTDADLARAKLVAALREFGMATEVIARVLRQLADHPDDWPGWFFIDAAGELREFDPKGAAFVGIAKTRLLAPRELTSAAAA